ncbi:hypothetical protein [Pseudomonas sp. TCU-HL1]|uniref:hypothetical protein n=1 Tax=Pseudomonas sp. TCU-HL1 TaxID=1856685 RepID=UPI00083E4510|nr:hypothetical protein [Pseudomonas sp. TCU-HL1]AOE84717.1 hypothetical protein THL1_2169 [Pseudomonas sp. TCU-HL1]
MAFWRGLGLVVLVLLGVIIAVLRGVDALGKAPVIPELYVPPAFSVARDFDFGRFRLAWRGVGFIVHPLNRPDQVLWRVEGGFLAAGKGLAEVPDARPGRELRDDRELLCREQSLEVFERLGRQLQLKGHLRCSDGSLSRYLLLLEDDGEQGVKLTVTLSESKLNRLYLTWHRDAEERFFGFGEVSGVYDLSGRRLAVSPAAKGRPGQGGANLATYWTSRVRAFHSQSSAYQVFDLRDSRRVSLEVHDGRLLANIYTGESLDELRARLSSATGVVPTGPSAK